MNKFISIFIIIFLTSCSKNFNKQNIITVNPPVTAKIEGKHLIFVSDKKLKHIKEIKSDDCESWALKLDIDKPLRYSIEGLLNKMFKDYTLTEKKLLKSEIEKEGYVSQISFVDFSSISKFKTERNTGKYNISLNITIKVENSSRNVTNEISSNMTWEKNIFLNCNLQDGAIKSGQKALETLIKKMYETTYESVFQVVL